ncbi:GIY-YIG nuclease family protein [Aneurinibacillus sp. Ricciae_BoGa-3]|uniref:GIY-YIG nuclease family protein n=1 Tax=Aneurinibacillus sp. Ricciae_BoGa-3 TaxID=3022697 RepID=UPI0023400A32|nr:GIY-YIG nuclease family protein [Aneurinibacillus sp. Ricciae_BoGa-3]WCK53444.1 GIY-YIG nuclease family protein [Aneurinibacillus sp. Ricciae_BoGa-3]
MYYVYIIRCKDNSLYTGYTNDVTARLKKHNEGKAARYTRGRAPVELAYIEEMADKSAAMRREYEIKQYSKKQKEKLVCSWKNVRP